MDSTILAALIAAVATIVAALIATVSLRRKRKKPPRERGTLFVAPEQAVPATMIEILPHLQRKYALRLRPTLKSVKFCQTNGRCFLQVTAEEMVAGYLQNECVKREDLGFIIDDRSIDGLFFSPASSLEKNVRRFLEEFDEVSIINCTDLFTEAAAAEVSAKSELQ